MAKGKGSGDALARGAVRASYGPMSEVSQDKWDDIFGPEEPPKPKRKRKKSKRKPVQS